MKISCPFCQTLLRAAQLNVATDVAVCSHCDEAFSISGLIAAPQGIHEFDVNQPPPGAWYDDTGTGWQVGASTRSPIAFFLVPFMCVWSGFSLGGIYGSQIVNGQFDLGMSLFGIPFVLGTLLFGSIAVMSVCGRIVVFVDGDRGRLFTGVGPLGWTRRFDWSTISRVEEDYLGYNHPGCNGLAISLVGQSRVKFGSMLTEERRFYLLQVLRQAHSSRRQ